MLVIDGTLRNAKKVNKKISAFAREIYAEMGVRLVFLGGYVRPDEEKVWTV